MNVRYKAGAKKNIRDIAAYLAEHDPRLPRRLIAALEETIQYLHESPNVGHLWRRLPSTPQLGYHAVRRFRNYLIFYLPLRDGIEIWRVLHGARDLRNLLKEEP